MYVQNNGTCGNCGADQCECNADHDPGVLDLSIVAEEVRNELTDNCGGRKHHKNTADYMAEADADAEAHVEELYAGFGAEMEPVPADEVTANAHDDLEVLDLDTAREQEYAQHLAHQRHLRELGLAR